MGAKGERKQARDGEPARDVETAFRFKLLHPVN